MANAAEGVPAIDFAAIDTMKDGFINLDEATKFIKASTDKNILTAVYTPPVSLRVRKEDKISLRVRKDSKEESVSDMPESLPAADKVVVLKTIPSKSELMTLLSSKLPCVTCDKK